MVPDVIAIATEGVTEAEIVMMILLLEAVTGLAHERLEVIIQFTVWPSVRALVE